MEKSSSTILPVLGVALPILLGLITASVAIYSLSRQIHQQNEPERKKLEAAYLTKALDDVNTPADALMKLVQDTHAFKNRLKFAPEERQANIQKAEAFLVEFQNSQLRYSNSMLRATYFAELIEDHSSLRKNGKNELFEALQAAQNAGVDLWTQIALDAQSERIPISELSKQPLYQRSEAASHHAAKAIIRRLQEIYGPS